MNIYCLKPRYLPFSSVFKRIEDDGAAEAEALALFPRYDDIVIERWSENPVSGRPKEIERRWQI